jgi:hypothetical protein
MSETTSRKLLVTTCDEKHRGQGAKGEYVIYEVAALDAEGMPVEEELRSFHPLPIGEEHEYEVTPYDHPKYGRSYTLNLPGRGPREDGGQKSPGARLGPKVDALREQVEAQAEQIGALNRRVSELEGRAAPTGGLMSRTTPTPDEEDIPF